jgi:hypothetical protein
MMAAFSNLIAATRRAMAPAAVRAGRATVTMPAGIITLNLAGIAAGTAMDWPGLLDMAWLVLPGITGIVFLTWVACRRVPGWPRLPGSCSI